MVSQELRVAYSMLSLEPGRPGGSEVNAAEILKQFSMGVGPVAVTALVTPRVRAAYESLASDHVEFAMPFGHPGASTRIRRAVALAASPAFAMTARRSMKQTPDVTHFPFTVPQPAAQGPSVVTLFDLNHRDLPYLWSASARAYRRVMYETAARRAEVVITSSEYSKSRIVAKVGVEPSRVHVIPLGIDHEAFNPQRTAVDDELARGLDLPDRFLLYPATMLAHKNHARLLQALARSANKDFSLVLTGHHNGAWPRLAAKARELGVERRLVHLGFLPRRLMPAVMRRAEALVFPSLYEGFGAPPLEAMACGTPVISALEASLREVCDGAVVAVDPLEVDSITNGIDIVMNDPELRADLVTRGLARSATFTWRSAAEQHLSAYFAAAGIERPV